MLAPARASALPGGRQPDWGSVTPAAPGTGHSVGGCLSLARIAHSLDPDALRLIIRRLAKKAGVKASPHVFRRTAAIERLRNGMNLLSLQRFHGHEKLETTQVYLTALRDDDVRERATRTSPGDDWRL